MTRRLCLWLACALVPAALATGCGGSSTTKSGNSAAVDAAKRDAAAAYRNCQSAATNSALTAAEKMTLETECAAIKSGDTSALRAAGKLLCRQEASALPPDKQKAWLKSCDAGVK